MTTAGNRCAAIGWSPNRFTVEPGHVYPDVEFVTEQHDHYWVVEKHPGEMPAD